MSDKRLNDRRELSRRNFLFLGAKSLAAFAAANVGVYAIGVAVKELDGSLVAGAKTCNCQCSKSAGFCSATPPYTAATDCFFNAPTCASVPSCSGTTRVQGCYGL